MDYVRFFRICLFVTLCFIHAENKLKKRKVFVDVLWKIDRKCVFHIPWLFDQKKKEAFSTMLDFESIATDTSVITHMHNV